MITFLNVIWTDIPQCGRSKIPLRVIHFFPHVNKSDWLVTCCVHSFHYRVLDGTIRSIKQLNKRAIKLSDEAARVVRQRSLRGRQPGRLVITIDGKANRQGSQTVGIYRRSRQFVLLSDVLFKFSNQIQDLHADLKLQIAKWFRGLQFMSA
jgi:hypothetical protein